MSELIPVVVASDANFLSDLQTTVASAIFHEKSHDLHIHLLDGGMHDWQWESLKATATALNPQTRLTRHRLDPAMLAKFDVRHEWTVMTYARVLVPLFVPEPYAIYVDSDFLVSKPLSDALPYLNSGKALGAVRLFEETLEYDCPWGRDLDLTQYPYVNAGLPPAQPGEMAKGADHGEYPWVPGDRISKLQVGGPIRHQLVPEGRPPTPPQKLELPESGIRFR